MKVIRSGRGELFTDPDPDHARAFFHQQARKMENKVMPLTKAVEMLVHGGDYLSLGGFGGNRASIAACHEILRQVRKNMGFADARRFVEKCEFITTPGWLQGGNSRYEAGLP